MPRRRLITKDSRVTVEFEYVVQNYLRSTLAANASWNGRRSQTYFNVYSEQDSRNSGAAQELSPYERRQLALPWSRLIHASLATQRCSKVSVSSTPSVSPAASNNGSKRCRAARGRRCSRSMPIA